MPRNGLAVSSKEGLIYWNRRQQLGEKEKESPQIFSTKNSMEDTLGVFMSLGWDEWMPEDNYSRIEV